MQIQDADYLLLTSAREQLSPIPTARSLYFKEKHMLFGKITSECEAHLRMLSVQSKFVDSAKLE